MAVVGAVITRWCVRRACVWAATGEVESGFDVVKQIEDVAGTPPTQPVIVEDCGQLDAEAAPAAST